MIEVREGILILTGTNRWEATARIIITYFQHFCGSLVLLISDPYLLEHPGSGSRFIPLATKNGSSRCVSPSSNLKLVFASVSDENLGRQCELTDYIPLKDCTSMPVVPPGIFP